MVLFDILVAELVLSFEGLDDAVGLLRDDVTPINDFLSFLHQATGQRNARQ